MKKLLALPLLFLLAGSPMLVGCKTQAYVAHPGSVNQFDSQAYDWVITTKAVIDSAKTDLANNVWTPAIAAKVKLVLNGGLVPAYNALDTAYISYHNAVATNPGASTTAVQNAINSVSTQTTALTSAKVGP
jgi:hypothetical protein